MLKPHSSSDHSSSGVPNGGLHPILLVDPDPNLRDTRRFLLAGLQLPVEAVSSSSEVFGLVPESSYCLVAISLTAGLSEVSHVAAYVRQRWPDAKILLLGESCEDLDDPLYDDRVNPVNPSGFADASKRLLAADVIGSRATGWTTHFGERS